MPKHFTQLKNPDLSLIVRLREQLAEHPYLWNQRTQRTVHPFFEGTDDIWVRANDDRAYRAGYKDWITFNDAHWPIWYEEAQALTAVKPLVYELMAQVRAEHLGGILITRIPAGGEVKPHHDFGWHATFHNCKVYVPIESNTQVWNVIGKERVNMTAGEAWTFNNLVTHGVRNCGDTPRVTLIISMRVDA